MQEDDVLRRLPGRRRHERDHVVDPADVLERVQRQLEDLAAHERAALDRSACRSRSSTRPEPAQRVHDAVATRRRDRPGRPCPSSLDGDVVDRERRAARRDRRRLRDHVDELVAVRQPVRLRRHGRRSAAPRRGRRRSAATTTTSARSDRAAGEDDDDHERSDEHAPEPAVDEREAQAMRARAQRGTSSASAAGRRWSAAIRSAVTSAATSPPSSSRSRASRDADGRAGRSSSSPKSSPFSITASAIRSTASLLCSDEVVRR